jgi:predicted nucleic acid-binding protein
MATAAIPLSGGWRVELRSQIRMSPDPDDDVFLNTAVDGRATLLVRGDQTTCWRCGESRGIPIVSAREAAERMEG